MPLETLLGIAPEDSYKKQRDKVPHIDEDLKTVSYGKIEYYEHDEEIYITDAEGVDQVDIEQYFSSFTSNKLNFEIEIPELNH